MRSPSAVVGHVYVNDNNTSGENSIGAFDRRADGTLTPMAGSPFAAGGPGSPAATLSQGALQLSGDGRYLLAVDRGSSQISVPTVNAPTALPADARLASNGTTLWVVDSGGNTVSGFVVDGGTVIELPQSPTPGPAGAHHIGIVVT
jgi:hypothetical protein